MLYKNSIKDDKRNLGDGQILFNNQEKKELLKERISFLVWSSSPLCFFHVESCLTAYSVLCDTVHLVCVGGVPAIPSPSRAVSCCGWRSIYMFREATLNQRTLMG